MQEASEVTNVRGVQRGRALGEQHRERLSDDLVGDVAEDLLGAAIEEHDPLALVDCDHRVRRDPDDARELRVGEPQLLFELRDFRAIARARWLDGAFRLSLRTRHSSSSVDVTLLLGRPENPA